MGHPEKLSPEETDPQTKDQPNRILVVDDEESSRDLCKDFLEVDGYSVETADRVQKALTLLNVKRFDLVITDLTMPKAEGLELQDASRLVQPRASRVILSDQIDPSADAKASDANSGRPAFLSKPWSNRNILEIVQGLAARESLPSQAG